ncbi:MAG: DNA adenine methylase [bacterium]|nr:DNA adenine methylase [bacterium]
MGRTANSAAARPFLKWAGGKGRLLSQYAPLFPAQIGNYHEPFLGSGAVFFSLRPGIRGNIHLSDRIEELISAYQTVRDDVEAVIRALKRHVYDRDRYYRVRGQDTAILSPPARAARFIYLNRTGYNGLYRVNWKGEFNVPFGRHKNPTICDAEGLRRASSVLQKAALSCCGFREMDSKACPGDFVYLDPPYHPLSKTANFTAYTAGSFGEEEQGGLAEVCRKLDGNGVRFMQSNSDTPFIRGLYKDFRVTQVQAARAINSRPNRRGKVAELVIRNYES